MPSFPAGVLLARLAACGRPVAKEAARRLDVREAPDFGPVPLLCRQAAYRRTSDDALLPHGRDGVLAVCGFALSLLEEAEQQTLFPRLCAEAGHTFFLDFKTPERNLEWPSALLFAPLRHAVSRCVLETQGGMEGVLYRERPRFSVLSRHTLLGGALCGILVRNSFI
ncbi:hypothetical protein [uncultured Mailhella sp.]|uniref:hypothetical protein n=1 Tax=uncultured Mailhella sp. TaxID=1981031 RepID=UPI0025CEF7FB|nr:hypothetical protein [uncultured Mailhella sp.]